MTQDWPVEAECETIRTDGLGKTRCSVQRRRGDPLQGECLLTRKKLLQHAGAGLAIVVVLSVALPASLPARIQVSRTIDIDAPAEKVYEVLSDLGQTVEWNPWVRRDPTIQTRHAGTGVGSTYEWEGDTAGKGRTTIIELSPPHEVRARVDIFEPMTDTFNAEWTVRQTSQGTRVTWRFDQPGGYFKRYLGLVMDHFLGPDFEEGLANLKAYVENPADARAEPDTEAM